jgi:hypothetical protein
MWRRRRGQEYGTIQEQIGLMQPRDCSLAQNCRDDPTMSHKLTVTDDHTDAFCCLAGSIYEGVNVE